MEKSRHRKWDFQGHMAGEWWRWDVSPTFGAYTLHYQAVALYTEIGKFMDNGQCWVLYMVYIISFC